MTNETFMDKAIQNLGCAKILLQNSGDDDVYLNYVGFHIQQAVELAIKYKLEVNGIEYPKTHDITQLIYLAKQNNVDIGITKYIDDHSEMLTIWESQTLNRTLEKRKIVKAIEETESFLCNQIERQENTQDNDIESNSGNSSDEEEPDM